MKNKFFTVLILFLLSIDFLFAQPWMLPPYMAPKNSPDSWKRSNFYEIETAFQKYELSYENSHPEINLRVDSNSEEDEDAVPGRLQFERWKYFMEPRVYPSGDISLPLATWKNYNGYISHSKQRKTSSAVPSNWSLIGPFSIAHYTTEGRVTFVVRDSANNNLWMGVSTGGLWKSTDDGQNWTTNTDTLGVITCSDLAIDPTNSNNMYLATGDIDGSHYQCIGILKSTDGGQTWDTTGLNWYSQYTYHTISKILIDPTNPNIVLAATNLGILKSTNGFSSFTNVSLPNDEFRDLKYKPGDPTIVYATNLYGKFFKSTDSGSSWIEITNGLTPTNAKVLIGTSVANPSYVYLLLAYTNFSSLYKSTDSGDSFSLVNNQNIIGQYGLFASALVVNPSNEDELFAGGGTLWHSTDGGVNWTGIPPPHVDIHNIQFEPGNNSLFVCSDGGLSKTTDGGISWSNLTSNLGINQVYRFGCSATDPGIVVEGSQDNGARILKNGTWSIFQPVGDCMESIVDYSDSNIYYTETQYGAIVKSINGGQNYTSITTISGTGVNGHSNWVTPYIIHPFDHNTLLVGKDQVYKTTNGGGTWNQLGSIISSANVTALVYAPSNPDYIYVTAGTKIFVSTDGTTLIDHTSGFPPNLVLTSIAVSNYDPARCWVTCSGYFGTEKIFFTNNAGLNWTNYSTGLPNLPANAIVYQNGSKDLLYVGMDVGIYFRDSTMGSWQLFNTGLPNVLINELEIQYTAGKLRAATFGRGIWESNLYSPLSVNEIPNGKYLSIYPNPFSTQTKIILSDHSNAIIELSDLTGKVIIRDKIFNGVYLLDKGNLQSGMYLLKAIENGNVIGVKKVIVSGE